jgi:hypothetical protein
VSKEVKIGLIVLAVAVAGYFAWRWWQNHYSYNDESQAQVSASNLSSVAPELVGGSAGPSVGSAPAVSLPVHVTIHDDSNDKSKLDPDSDKPAAVSASRSSKPVQRQRHASGVTSGISGGVMSPAGGSRDLQPVAAGSAEASMPPASGRRGVSSEEKSDVKMRDASHVKTPGMDH